MNAMEQEHHKALIMVVDDNPEFLDGIETTLQMEGFQVWTVTDGQQALDQLKAAFLGQGDQNVPWDRLPDLILADIMMPVMDGYDFYDKVRANPFLNHIPFIFLTAKDAKQDIRYGKELGADDYLTKLFSTPDLLASIRGKLKRVEQQQALATQFTGDPTAPLEGGRLLVAIIALVLVLVGACLGAIIALGLFS